VGVCECLGVCAARRIRALSSYIGCVGECRRLWLPVSVWVSVGVYGCVERGAALLLSNGCLHVCVYACLCVSVRVGVCVRRRRSSLSSFFVCVREGLCLWVCMKDMPCENASVLRERVSVCVCGEGGTPYHHL